MSTVERGAVCGGAEYCKGCRMEASWKGGRCRVRGRADEWSQVWSSEPLPQPEFETNQIVQTIDDGLLKLHTRMGEVIGIMSEVREILKKRANRDGDHRWSPYEKQSRS